jgi:hypothetical protein
MVNITYPTTGGWSYKDLVAMPDYWIIDSHDTANGIIVLRGTGGHFIAPGQSATFSFNMTSGASNGAWSVTCINTAMQNASATLTVEVDDTAPIVSISSPSAGRVSGAVWINATINEAHLKEWVIKINGTQVTTGTTTSVSYQWNTTSYADASYVINVTATDIVGNIGFKDVTVEVDNTAPQLIEIVLGAFIGTTWSGNYTPTGDTFWIPGAIDGIKINATFRDTSATLSGNVYFNVTQVPFVNNSWIGSPYSISGVNSIPVKINITDDQGNRYVHTWTVSKDFNSPTAPTYTEYQLIRGGIIVRGINSTDAESGVANYTVYINGTAEQVTPTQLANSTWQSSGNLSRFSGILVVNLTAYAGKAVNITITAVDNAGLESNATTVYIGSVPEGEWYAIELYEGYNLVSLPLIPNSTARADIYSLILKQGAEGVKITYSFDNQAKTWTLNPATMTDGAGYWINMKAYDVLIVQGTPIEEYWGLEPIYYPLYTGWNLVGYTATEKADASGYLGSLDTNSYYRYVYVWNAKDQRWMMVKAVADSGKLSPGQGFWILLYSDQTLIPPVPS